MKEDSPIGSSYYLPTQQQASYSDSRSVYVARDIEIRSVKTVGGWRGQIVILSEVVWESAGYDTKEEALKLANERLRSRLTSLFYS